MQIVELLGVVAGVALFGGLSCGLKRFCRQRIKGKNKSERKKEIGT